MAHDFAKVILARSNRVVRSTNLTTVKFYGDYSSMVERLFVEQDTRDRTPLLTQLFGYAVMRKDEFYKHCDSKGYERVSAGNREYVINNNNGKSVSTEFVAIKELCANGLDAEEEAIRLYLQTLEG